MAVSAMSFIFDNKSSEDFGVYIGGFDNNAIKNDMASTNIQFIQDFLPSRGENFIYGIVQNETNLQFKLNMFGYDYFSKNDISYIDNWLFANKKPKKLMFCQEDMATYTYMAVFSKNEIIYHCNRPIGFECDVVCDSAYAYEAKKTEVYNIVNSKYTNIRFNNLSGGINYLYPEISWTCNKDNGVLTIVNLSDNNRTFTITGLKVGEKITIDKFFQITSSLGLYRCENCNKEWLRLRNGINNIRIIGDTGKLYMTYQFKKAIGS